MRVTYIDDQRSLKNRCPFPNSIDFDIYAMGGSTVALDLLRGDVCVEQSGMSLEQRVAALNTKLVRVTEELHYYERVASQSQFPALGCQQQSAIISDGLRDSNQNSQRKAEFEEIQQQIDQITTYYFLYFLLFKYMQRVFDLPLRDITLLCKQKRLERE
ncbi:hypothetical protein VCV18_011398 [Metarhizium anisopliae]